MVKITAAICVKNGKEMISSNENLDVEFKFKLKFIMYFHQFRFNKFPTLKGHMRLHAYPLKYKCQYCNTRFRLERHLISHLRSHSDYIEFSCEVCNKKCKSAFALKVSYHGKQHSFA